MSAKTVKTVKTVKRIHINRAEIVQIKRWQHNAKRQISHLESNKFAVVVFDEAIFIDDPASGVKYWSKKGEPIVLPYKGRHGRVVVVWWHTTPLQRTADSTLGRMTGLTRRWFCNTSRS